MAPLAVAGVQGPDPVDLGILRHVILWQLAELAHGSIHVVDQWLGEYNICNLAGLCEGLPKLRFYGWRQRQKKVSIEIRTTLV